jgi:hypothetical protein
MLYTVAIAVCLSATPMQNCSEATSVAWIVAPEHPGSMVGCIRHGMLYAAESNLVSDGSYAKIFCSSGMAGGRTAELRP